MFFDLLKTLKTQMVLKEAERQGQNHGEGSSRQTYLSGIQQSMPNISHLSQKIRKWWEKNRSLKIQLKEEPNSKGSLKMIPLEI